MQRRQCEEKFRCERLLPSILTVWQVSSMAAIPAAKCWHYHTNHQHSQKSWGSLRELLSNVVFPSFISFFFLVHSLLCLFSLKTPSVKFAVCFLRLSKAHTDCRTLAKAMLTIAKWTILTVHFIINNASKYCQRRKSSDELGKTFKHLCLLLVLIVKSVLTSVCKKITALIDNYSLLKKSLIAFRSKWNNNPL